MRQNFKIKGIPYQQFLVSKNQRLCGVRKIFNFVRRNTPSREKKRQFQSARLHCIQRRMLKMLQ